LAAASLHDLPYEPCFFSKTVSEPKQKAKFRKKQHYICPEPPWVFYPAKAFSAPMKALIPVAGAGTRLRPHTFTQPKPLIPVAGKPIIAFILDQLLAVGIQEFVFVIGYLGEKIEEYVEQHYPHVKTTFVHQPERMGLGHAVLLAEEAISGSDEVFIVLGDTIFDTDLKAMLEMPESCIGLKKVDDPRKFGVAELDEAGFVRTLVEKPKIPKSNLAIVGLYKIKEVPALMEAIKYNIRHNIRTVDEFQLTDALMRMVEQGVKIKSFPVNNWFDCGRKEILLETNAMLLKRAATGEPLPPFENSIIIPPVFLGKDCVIRNAIIGPNVTVGDHATIVSSIVKNSIIGSYSSLEEVVLHKSVIGSDAVVKGLSQSLNIGDNTEIDFG
jgi:glucose-1-phosphate thymidylyltransferase